MSFDDLMIENKRIYEELRANIDAYLCLIMRLERKETAR